MAQELFEIGSVHTRPTFVWVDTLKGDHENALLINKVYDLFVDRPDGLSTDDKITVKRVFAEPERLGAFASECLSQTMRAAALGDGAARLAVYNCTRNRTTEGVYTLECPRAGCEIMLYSRGGLDDSDCYSKVIAEI